MFHKDLTSSASKCSSHLLYLIPIGRTLENLTLVGTVERMEIMATEARARNSRVNRNQLLATMAASQLAILRPITYLLVHFWQMLQMLWVPLFHLHSSLSSCPAHRHMSKCLVILELPPAEPSHRASSHQLLLGVIYLVWINHSLSSRCHLLDQHLSLLAFPRTWVPHPNHQVLKLLSVSPSAWLRRPLSEIGI